MASATALDNNNPYTFNVMTINMGNSAKNKDGTKKYSNDQHREAVDYALTVTNHPDSPIKPHIVFVQELGSKDVKKHWKLNDRLYEKMNTETEAGLMWRPQVFTKLHKIDTAFVTRVLDGMRLQGDSLSGIRARSSIAVLERKTSGESPSYKVLVISWHGPRSVKEPRREKLLRELQQFAVKLRDRVKQEYGDDEIAILIGGDFNIAFTKYPYRKEFLKTDTIVEPFHYQRYSQSQRRRSKKKELLDNFLYTEDSIELTDITVLEPQEVEDRPTTSTHKTINPTMDGKRQKDRVKTWKLSVPCLNGKPATTAQQRAMSSATTAQQRAMSSATAQVKTAADSTQTAVLKKTADGVWVKEEDDWRLYSSQHAVMEYIDHDPILATIHIR